MTELQTNYRILITPDFKEIKDRYIFKMAVPGFTRDDIIVKVQRDTVNILWEESEYNDDLNLAIHCGPNCDLAETTKEVCNGVLYVTIPKKEEDLDFEVE